MMKSVSQAWIRKVSPSLLLNTEFVQVNCCGVGPVPTAQSGLVFAWPRTVISHFKADFLGRDETCRSFARCSGRIAKSGSPSSLLKEIF